MLWCILVQGQSIGGTTQKQHNAQSAAKYAQVTYNPANVKQLEYQRRAWEEVVKQEPLGASHWFNYYMTARLFYVQTNGGKIDSMGKRELSAIAAGMDSSIADANSFEKLMVQYFEAPAYKRAATYIEMAIEKDGYNFFLKSELPKYYYYRNETAKRNDALSNVSEVSPATAVYSFCRAMVQTLPDSAIIITNGDYDTYSTWLGAITSGKKIGVISLKWLEDEDLRLRMLEDANMKLSAYKKEDVLGQLIQQNLGRRIFIALTVNPGYLKGIKQSLYNTGFCYQYSAIPFNNMDVLYHNLVLFPVEIYKPVGSAEVLKNCMTGFITLFRHYKETDKEQADKIIGKAREIAGNGGFWNEYVQYFK